MQVAGKFAESLKTIEDQLCVKLMESVKRSGITPNGNGIMCKPGLATYVRASIASTNKTGSCSFELHVCKLRVMMIIGLYTYIYIRNYSTHFQFEKTYRVN